MQQRSMIGHKSNSMMQRAEFHTTVGACLAPVIVTRLIDFLRLGFLSSLLNQAECFIDAVSDEFPSALLSTTRGPMSFSYRTVYANE